MSVVSSMIVALFDSVKPITYCQQPVIAIQPTATPHLDTMSKPVNKTEAAAELRKKAVAAFQERAGATPQDSAPLTPEATSEMLHELQVHQIELEMQKEELHRVQEELDVSRAHYFDLYDLAPVGYCRVSKDGVILEANLTLANLLGVARDKLVTKPFSRFIFKEDEDCFYRLRAQSMTTSQPRVCELRMVPRDGLPFWVELAVTADGGAEVPPVMRMVVSDITERKLAEMALMNKAKELLASNEELKQFNQAMVGRELRMIELKQEINKLCRRLGEPPLHVTDRLPDEIVPGA